MKILRWEGGGVGDMQVNIIACINAVLSAIKSPTIVIAIIIEKLLIINIVSNIIERVIFVSYRIEFYGEFL